MPKRQEKLNTWSSHWALCVVWMSASITYWFTVCIYNIIYWFTVQSRVREGLLLCRNRRWEFLSSHWSKHKDSLELWCGPAGFQALKSRLGQTQVTQAALAKVYKCNVISGKDLTPEYESFKHLCVLLVFLEQPKSCSRKFLKSIRFVSFTRNKSSSEVKYACQYSHWRWQCTCLSSLPEFQKRIMYFIELFHNPEQELFQFLHNPHHYWSPSPIHPIPGNQLWTHKTKFKAHNSNANSQQRHVP